MVKGNQYQIWLLYGSIDLMKVVWGLEDSGKTIFVSKGGTKGENIFAFGPPFECKKIFPGVLKTPDYFHKIN